MSIYRGRQTKPDFMQHEWWHCTIFWTTGYKCSIWILWKRMEKDGKGMFSRKIKTTSINLQCQIQVKGTAVGVWIVCMLHRLNDGIVWVIIAHDFTWSNQHPLISSLSASWASRLEDGADGYFSGRSILEYTVAGQLLSLHLKLLIICWQKKCNQIPIQYTIIVDTRWHNIHPSISIAHVVAFPRFSCFFVRQRFWMVLAAKSPSSWVDKKCLCLCHQEYPDSWLAESKCLFSTFLTQGEKPSKETINFVNRTKTSGNLNNLNQLNFNKPIKFHPPTAPLCLDG